MKGFPSLHEFLETSGVLEHGPEAIEIAKKEYRRLYKLEHRRRQREKKVELQPAFTQAEAERVREAAERHEMSPRKFVQEACMAYLNQRIMNPDRGMIAELEVLLAKSYSEISRLTRASEGNYRLRLMELERQVERMEQALKSSFKKLKTLDEILVETCLDRPDLIDHFLTLIKQTYASNQVTIDQE